MPMKNLGEPVRTADSNACRSSSVLSTGRQYCGRSGRGRQETGRRKLVEIRGGGRREKAEGGVERRVGERLGEKEAVYREEEGGKRNRRGRLE